MYVFAAFSSEQPQSKAVGRSLRRQISYQEVRPVHETIAVAMSGGVDSSVAAWLLREQGHALLGLTMALFPGC